MPQAAKLNYLNNMPIDYYNINFKPTWNYSAKELLVLWSLGILIDRDPNLKRPNRKIDATYRGWKYDFYLEWTDCENKLYYTKIKVRASRVNDRERNDGELYFKAISANSKRPFLINYQQIKPKCCDVFIWIAVYRDRTKYWVINSNEIQKNPYLTPQHRNQATSEREKDYKKEDVYEGQIMVTNDNISYFDKYLTDATKLKEAIISQYKIQHNLK